MATASAILAAMADSGKTLHQLATGFQRYPQVLHNVRVAEKIPFTEVPDIAEESAKIEHILKGRGRLLLRYSGTEKLARIMLEGEDQAEIDSLAVRLGETIKRHLG